MNWFIHLSWWQWVLIVAINSFLGYWAGVGTLYCWHQLELMEWKYFEGGINDRRKIFFSFLMWPGSTTDKLQGYRWHQPFSMDDMKPNTYLLFMIIFGPIPKVLITMLFYILCGVVFLFNQIKMAVSVPQFIKQK